MKPTDEQCLDVIHFCISYLYEKCSSERGLFRSTVSQTDVRLLQTQIVQSGQTKFREELDPHLVAEVLHTSLKDLRTPLLHEVYQDILNTELVEDNYEANKATVLKWIENIPVAKLSIVKSYFQLLTRLASLEDNDASLTQLAYTIAPAICRPTTSAYMSIRHMEDLKRIRPVVMFLMGNSEDVLKDVQGAAPRESFSGDESTIEDKDNMLAEMMTSSMVIDSSSKPMMGLTLATFSDEGSESSNNEGNVPFIRPPGLLVSIPSVPSINLAVSSASTNNFSNDTNAMELESSEETKRPAVAASPYNDADWKILYFLVCNRMANFLELDDNETSQFTTREVASESYCSVMQAWGAKQIVVVQNPSPMKADISSVPVSPSSSIGSLNRAASLQKSSFRRSYRRKMVADCKALRAQIHEFEQEFTLKNNRLPKPQERGAMNSIYIKYRELKRDIRDNAAMDIQRVYRGWKDRLFVRRRKLLALSRSDDGDQRKVAYITPTLGESRNNQSGNKNLVGGSISVDSSSSTNLFKRYRELRDSKRDLKKKLKKFDEDFLAQYGRNPKKSDKEVIRPMYQKYHEIKNSLEELRTRCALSKDPIPEDLLEDILSPNGQHHDSTLRRSAGDSDFETDELDRSASKSRPKSAGAPEANKTSISSSVSKSSVSVVGSNADSTSTNPSTTPEKKPSPTLDDLQQEKKNLHAYLKVYERDFNRTHGRPVMKNEDILPVAGEYQRYKELKNLIKEMKIASP